MAANVILPRDVNTAAVGHGILAKPEDKTLVSFLSGFHFRSSVGGGGRGTSVTCRWANDAVTAADGNVDERP